VNCVPPPFWWCKRGLAGEEHSWLCLMRTTSDNPVAPRDSAVFYVGATTRGED
jgi:hypothetical protein